MEAHPIHVATPPSRSATDIQLSSGLYYDFKSPDPAVITIPVIAHALSNICRYTGHTSRFYSVAEHCVRASRIDPKHPAALDVLMHDAAEAFVADIATPFKRLLGAEYKKYEDSAETLIAAKWGLRWLDDGVHMTEVKRCDLIMLATEKRDLLPTQDDWPVLAGIDPLEDRILSDHWEPAYWRDQFINRFVEISRER